MPSLQSMFCHRLTNGMKSDIRVSLRSAFDNYFLQAQKVREQIRRDFDCVFRLANPLRRLTGLGTVDILLHPSAIRTAPQLSETDTMEELDAYVQDVLTVPASLAGLPALSVPAGLGDDSWPLGISVVSQWGHDDLILRFGEVIESITSLNHIEDKSGRV